MVSASAVGILGPGNGRPAGGVSGGGVFYKGRLAGLYRGAFIDTGEHLFLPITRLREWCDFRGYELVNPAYAPAAKLLQDKFLSRIGALPWTHFLGLIGSLGFNAAKFSKSLKAEELFKIFSGAVADSGTPIDLVTEKLNEVLEVTTEEEFDIELMRQNVDDATRAIGNVSQRGPGTGLPAQAKPMVSLVRERLGAIRAAKAVHDLVQHQFAFKIDAYASAATRLGGSNRVAVEARRTVRAMQEDIENVLQHLPGLLPAYRGWLQNETATVRQSLGEIAASLRETAASPNVDLITSLEMTLKPFAAQVPSKMQEILAIEVSSLPLDPLVTILSQSAAAGRDEFRSLGSLQVVLVELVAHQGGWQSLHNELFRLNERLDPFFESSKKTELEVIYLARNLMNLARQTPEAITCESLASGFYTLITKLPPDEMGIRFRFEEFVSFVSDMFKRADEKLLRACDQLQELSDSLNTLVDSFH